MHYLTHTHPVHIPAAAAALQQQQQQQFTIRNKGLCAKGVPQPGTENKLAARTRAPQYAAGETKWVCTRQTAGGRPRPRSRFLCLLSVVYQVALSWRNGGRGIKHMRVSFRLDGLQRVDRSPQSRLAWSAQDAGGLRLLRRRPGEWHPKGQRAALDERDVGGHRFRY